MRQFTAKTPLDVVRWVETNGHYYASVEDPGFMILKGPQAILRIPEAVRKAAAHLIAPCENPFDTRMYRATPAGRKRLQRAARS